MRITNTMMTSNTMRNVNKSKSNLYTTEEQMSSQKKINKPSDDPIIAIRALSLRTSLSEVEQFLKKNVPDASAWISLTETSLKNMDDVFTDIYGYCNQGATDSFTTDNREAIIQTIGQLKAALYDEGNADYSGRYIFTGYRTDRALTFQSDAEANATYKIKQQFSGDDFTTTKYVKNSVDINNIANIAAKDRAQTEELYRIRLAYDQCSDAVPPTVEVDGANYTVASVSEKELEDLITAGTMADNTAYYVHDRGELVFTENTYKNIKAADSINVEYQKDSFKKGDVRPEHYYDCSDITDPTNTVNYTMGDRQDIEYTINFSQSLKVNTLASEVLSTDIARDIDDLTRSLSRVAEVEAKIAKLKEMKGSSAYKGNEDELESMITAANKELDYVKADMESTFSKSMTYIKNFQNNLNKEIADVGSREVRLTLAKTRLTQQQTTFKDLKSKNEDVELEEITIEFSAAETVYNAAIATAAKTVRQSLLDYL